MTTSQQYCYGRVKCQILKEMDGDYNWSAAHMDLDHFRFAGVAENLDEAEEELTAATNDLIDIAIDYCKVLVAKP